MKKILILLLFAILSSNLYSQRKCQSEIISNRIDTICKNNNITECQVYFYYEYSTFDNTVYHLGTLLRASGKFKLDDCFLIINDKVFFDLSKLINFSIQTDEKDSNIKTLILHFQGI